MKKSVKEGDAMKAKILSDLVIDLVNDRTSIEGVPIGEIIRYARVLDPEVDVFRYIDFGEPFILFTFTDGSDVTYGDEVRS